MLRLTLAARIGLIMLVGLILVWIAALAIYMRLHAPDLFAGDGLPKRVAALTELVEETTGEQRGRVLAAVSTDQFVVHIEPDGGLPSRGDADEARRGVFAATLDGRPFSLATLPNDQRFLGRLLASPRNAVEIQVALHGGGILDIVARTPVLVTPQGLPVGFAAGLFGTVVALLALVVMQRETRPLARLAKAVDAIELSGEPALLPDARRSAPEIRALVGAFNRLQTRLGSLLKARMAMLGGISHDVRTFAARLRLRVDAIPDEAERDRAVADIADMIRLLDDAVLASRAGVGELAQELVEPAEIIRTEIADRQAHCAPVALSVAPPAEDAAVLGDRLAVRRIAANLIDNALRYGSRVEVTLSVDERFLAIAIDDDGPGIPAAQRTLLLEPFVRLEESRSRRTGGAGLGLAVVRSLAEGMGGTVEISEAPIGGARVVARLPVFQPS